MTGPEQVLCFVAAMVSQQGIPPTLDEIGRAVDCAPTTARLRLLALEGQGLVHRRPVPRGLGLTRQGWERVTDLLPVVPFEALHG